MSENKDQKNDTVRRLDAMIGLMVLELISQNKIGTGKIYKLLRDSGLTPTEIGRIANREAKDVGATITMYEKNENKKNISKLKQKKKGDKKNE